MKLMNMGPRAVGGSIIVYPKQLEEGSKAEGMSVCVGRHVDYPLGTVTSVSRWAAEQDSAISVGARVLWMRNPAADFTYDGIEYNRIDMRGQCSRCRAERMTREVIGVMPSDGVPVAIGTCVVLEVDQRRTSSLIALNDPELATGVVISRGQQVRGHGVGSRLIWDRSRGAEVVMGSGTRYAFMDTRPGCVNGCDNAKAELLAEVPDGITVERQAAAMVDWIAEAARQQAYEVR